MAIAVRTKNLNIAVASQESGEKVLEDMNNLIHEVGVATVSDLYNILRMKSSYKDDIIGWKDLSGAKVKPVGEKYFVIEFPDFIHADYGFKETKV